VREFERRLVGRFEHLDADGTSEPPTDFARDALHGPDGAGWQGRLDVRQIVAVLEDDGIHAGLAVEVQVGQRLGHDSLVIAGVARRAWEWQHGDHRAEEFIGKGSHGLFYCQDFFCPQVAKVEKRFMFRKKGTCFMKRKTEKAIEQPMPFTPGMTKAMVRQHAYELYRDKLPDHPLTLQDWVLAEKDLAESMQTENLLT